MRIEKVTQKGTQELEKIHLTEACEVFVLYDPKHKPFIRILKQESLIKPPIDIKCTQGV